MKSNPDWTIAATQGPTRYLILTGEEVARILDEGALTLFPEFPIHSLVARGYWTAYEGPKDALEGLLKGVIDDNTLVGAFTNAP